MRRSRDTEQWPEEKVGSSRCLFFRIGEIRACLSADEHDTVNGENNVGKKGKNY